MTKMEFYDKYCAMCGTQRCGGVGDTEWAEGCKWYQEHFCGRKDDIRPTLNAIGDVSCFHIGVNLLIELTMDDVDDIMASALEGGITYWCGSAEVVGDYLGEYSSEQISRGGSLILHDAESDDKWELTREKFLNGFKRWVAMCGDKHGAVHSDGTVDTGMIDGEMADMIVQYALFDDIVFG